MEHSVPEQLFSKPENPVEGISAVKALYIANDQGIPIYTINQSNINTILPQLQLDAGTIAGLVFAALSGYGLGSCIEKTFYNWEEIWD